MLRKIIKILLIVAGSLAGLLLMLVLLIWMGLFNGIVKNTIIKQANNNINGELRIGDLRGNLLSDVTLQDITLFLDSDTLLFSREVKIDYSLLPLLKKELIIDLVSIIDTRLNAVQKPDSSWNFMKLVKESAVSDTSQSEGFGLKIIVNKLTARRLSADITPADTLSIIPQYAETGFMVSAAVNGDTITAQLDSMKLVTEEPAFVMEEFTGWFSKKGNGFEWNDVVLQLTNSLLTTRGHYSPALNGLAGVELEMTPLDFEDIRTVLPDLPVYGSPDITLRVEGDEAKYELTGSVKEENQSLDITGSLSDFRNNPDYFLNIIMHNIDGSSWTGDKQMKTNISGNLNITGKGFDIKQNELALDGTFGNISYAQYSFSDLRISFRKNGDNAEGGLSSETFAGDINLRYDLSDIFSTPAYDITAAYSNINIAKLPGVDSLSSDLNGELHVKGRGTSPENIIAILQFKSDASSVQDEPLGDFGLNLDYDRGNFNFALTDFGAPYFALNAEGSGNIKIEGDVSFSLEPLDISRLAEAFGMPRAVIAGKITGNISGNADSIQANADILLDSIVYDTIMIAGISSEVNVRMIEKALSAGLRLSTGEIRAGSLSLESAEITGNYSGENATADIRLVVSDSLQANFSGSVEGFENPLVRIRQLGISYNGSQWSTPGDSAFLVMDKDAISVHGFALSSGDQNIRADGQFAFRGDEDMTVEISDLDLQSLPLNEFLPYEVSGSLSSGFSLTGTASEPILNSKISMDEVEINGFQIDSIRLNLVYENDLLQLTGRVLTGLYESVALALDVPVSVSLSDSTVLLADTPGLSGSLRVDSLDLAKISGFLPVKDISAEGFADLNVNVGNTISKPVISGSFSLDKARFRDRRFGIDYRDIRMFASIDSSTIGLDTLNMRTGKGNLAMNGFVSLQNTDSLQANDFDIKLRAKDFQAVESGSIELNFDSDLDLSGTLGKPGFKGGFSINSSKINIDYFSEYFSQKSDEPNPPLLIEALRDTVEITAADTSSKGPSFSGSTFYKTLAGEATIDIPGNTWITGKDMNFELNGTVRAVKASENISLFGDLNVKRGYYKIYGRNFDFEKGKITFTGSSDFNPDVDFEIVYRFRDIEKQLRDLKLYITGKLMQPDLRFMLGDEAVEEKDAISYIVFGRSVNQLGEGEREKISGQDVAMGAAVTQLSSALKGVLQESAGVDVFEVTGGEDWKSGNVTIGKYITNNLFLSYERSFDFNKHSKAANIEKIMLEYQLLRNLLLKATNQEINSGFDLIWRKSWK